MTTRRLEAQKVKAKIAEIKKRMHQQEANQKLGDLQLSWVKKAKDAHENEIANQSKIKKFFVNLFKIDQSFKNPYEF